MAKAIRGGGRDGDGLGGYPHMRRRKGRKRGGGGKDESRFFKDVLQLEGHGATMSSSLRATKVNGAHTD